MCARFSLSLGLFACLSYAACGAAAGASSLLFSPANQADFSWPPSEIVKLIEAKGSTGDAGAGSVLKLSPDKAEELKKALLPKPAPAVLLQQALEELFKRLKAANDEDEAKAIATAIEHIWLRSGSDTANLLMSRAGASIEAKNYALALTLLDKIIDLHPGWVAAINQRATVRFLSHDVDGAMSDINETLKLEPRDFDALNGLAMMLEQTGFEKRALEVLKKSLTIYPHQAEVEKLVKKLELEIEGRDI
jgi:tetratricopeptide (TPR) repeat protein